MSNLEIIQALSQLAEEQNEIIVMLSDLLKEAGVTSVAAEEKIRAAHDKFTAILGTDEVPDNLS